MAQLKDLLVTGPARFLTQIKANVEGDLAGNADTATKDASGNIITSTYATKTELENEAAAREAADATKVNRAGDTMGGELVFNGGDAAGASKIVFTPGKGQITNNSTATLFGFTSNTDLAVGHSSYALKMRGSATHPTYNDSNLAVSNQANTFSGVTTFGANAIFKKGSTQAATPSIKWEAFKSKTPFIGYCTSSTDDTFMIGSLDGTSYTTGLAIGGSSGNLLWKGSPIPVATRATLTASRALASDSTGKITQSAVTSTELGYLSGVTSAIQTQINGKQATVTGAATTITGSNLTANRALVSNSSGKVAVSEVTSTELGYLDGVTSSIQTQLNNKSENNHTHTNLVSRGNVTAETGTTRPAVAGLSMSQAYDNGYPSTYGNVLTLKGAGDGELFIGWSGISGGHAPVYVRSKRDVTDANWSSWAKIYTTADRPYKDCYVGQSTSTTTNPWYKFASVSIPTSTTHQDKNITFKVSQGYGDNSSYTGILTAHVRTGSNGIFEQAQLIWEYANDSVVTSDFILAYKYTEGVSVAVELWAKQDCAYAKFHFKVLSEYNRNEFEDAWTLYNANSAGQAASPTSGYTHIESTLGVLRASKVYGAVWNDYAEYRESAEKIKPGRVVIENGNGSISISEKRLVPGASIVSDTYGFIIGETEKCKTPVATAGRVLRYPFEDKTIYNAGDAVCTGPNGTVSKMTREEIKEYPDCILGYVSEIPTYEEWSEKHIKVNGRIWIKI